MTPSSTTSCVADRGTLAERVSERGERWFVPSGGQDVSLANAGIRTALGRDEGQEPN